MALKNLNQMSTLGGGSTILNSSTNRGSEFLLRQEEEKKKAEEKRRAQIRALDELEAEAGFRNLSQNKIAPVSDNFGTVGQNKPLSAIGQSGLGLSGKVIDRSVATTAPKMARNERFGESVKGIAKRAGTEILGGLAEIGDLGVTAVESIKGGLDFTKASGGGTKGMPTLGVLFEEHDTRTFGKKIIQNDSKAVLKDIKKDASAFAEGAEDYKKQYLTSGNTLTDKAEAEIEAVKKEYEDVLGSGAGALIGDVVGSTARQLPRLVISAIPGFGGAAATATMFATGSNSAYKEALENGATDEEAKVYSILAGAVEAGGEYAIGGILGQGTGYLDDLLKISKKITNPIARTAANIFGSSVGEGFEEMAQSVLTTIVQRITYDPDAKVDFTELAYEGLIGALSAGLMSGVNFRGQYRGAKNEIGQIQAEKALGTMSSEDILSAIDSVHETAVELGQEEQFNSALLSVYEKAYGDKASFTERLRNNAKKILDPETEAKANSLGILSTADLSEDAKIAVAKAAAKYGIGTAGTRVTGMQTGTDLGSIGEAERLSKLTGSKVMFFDEGVIGGAVSNGYEENGIIHVNRQAKNPLAVVLSHELTHTLEGSSSYDDLSYIVFKTLRESGSDIGQMIDDRMTLYAKHNVSLTEEDARREIVADYVSENFMGSEEQIRNIVAQDRPLAVRIREFLDRVLARFGNAGAQKRVVEYDRVREIRDAYKRALGERVDEQTGTKFSFAGVNSMTADLDALLKAQNMETNGETKENILSETGWFRGADGKWRYEIDDSGMKYYSSGDARFREAHPEYAEYQSLVDKMIDGTITPDEDVRMRELYQTWGNERTRLSKIVSSGNAMLRNILDHQALFEAYPELATARVVFEELEPGTNGYYNRSKNTIALSQDLRNAPESTLLHEIQHAIQDIEGFARGSSPEYWMRNSGQEYKNDARFIAADNKYKNIFGNAPNDFKNMVRAINRARLDDDYDEVMRIEDELYASEYADMYSELSDADFDRRVAIERAKNRSPYNLYENTAGEIEARDVSSRRNLTTEERRARFPDIGNEDTVFADDGGDSFEYIGKTKNGTRVYKTDFADNVSENERIEQFKDRIATIFNLGAVTLHTGTKKITVNGDRFTMKKNLKGDDNATPEEMAAKINALYDMADILSGAKFQRADPEISYINPSVKPKNKAHKGVKYWYKFSTDIVMDGSLYTVTFNIRDKGKGGQYQYLIDFKKNETHDANDTAVSSFAPASHHVSREVSIAEAEPIVNRKFSLSVSENTETAKQHFGTTRDWAETGYLLTDGTQLDFSGRHWGGDGGYREVDHRDINEALGEDIPGNEAMVSFMAEGNIRISPETGGINISVMPTKEQERALRSFVREYGGEVILDIDNENGVTVSSTEYPAKTSAEKVINDIRAYFETGATPVVSDLGRFRQYSISEVDGETGVRDEDVLYERGMTDEDVAAEMEAAERRRQLGSAERQMNAAVISGNPRLQNYYRLAELADRQRSNPLDGVDDSLALDLNEEQRGRLEDAVRRYDYDYDRAAQDYNDAVRASLEGQFVSAETAQKITDSLLEAEAQWQERDPLESLDEDIVNALGADKAAMFADQLRENNRRRAAEAAEWRAQAPIIPDTMSSEEYSWNNLGQLQEMADWQQSDVRRNVTKEDVEAANERRAESEDYWIRNVGQAYREQLQDANARAAERGEELGQKYTPKTELSRSRRNAPAITLAEYEGMPRKVRGKLNSLRGKIANSILGETEKLGYQLRDYYQDYLPNAKEKADEIAEKFLESYTVNGTITKKEVINNLSELIAKLGQGETNGENTINIVGSHVYDIFNYYSNDINEQINELRSYTDNFSYETLRGDSPDITTEEYERRTKTSSDPERMARNKIAQALMSEIEKLGYEIKDTDTISAKDAAKNAVAPLVEGYITKNISPNDVSSAISEFIIAHSGTEPSARHLNAIVARFNEALSRYSGQLNEEISSIRDYADSFGYENLRGNSPVVTAEEFDDRAENVSGSANSIRNKTAAGIVAEIKKLGYELSDVEGGETVKDDSRKLSNAIIKAYVTGDISRDQISKLVGDFVSKHSGTAPSTRDMNALGTRVNEILSRYSEELNRHATIVREYADAKKAEESGEAVRSFDDVEAKEYIEKWKEYGRAKRRLDSLERKRVMTNAERITYQKLKTGQISPDSLTGAGSEVLLEMYEAYKAAEDLKREVNSYSNALKKARREKAIKLLGDISKWKDGRPFGQHIKTMERNIRKSAPDSKTAREMIKEYIQPVYNANAAATRYKNEIRKKIQDLNIKTKPNKGDKISESYAIQFIGEAQDAIQRITESKGRIETVAGFTLDDWTGAIVQIRNENPGIDFDKVNRDIEAIRSIYDEMIEKMNIAYVKAGYAPIDYRKGYFPHFQEEKGDGLLAKFTKEIGLTPDYVAALPTEINGQTHKFRPGVKYNRHKLSRGQGNTIAVVYDAVKGMDMYLETAASVIYMTDAIQNLRALEQGIKYATSKEGIRAQIDEIQNDVEKSAEEKENAIEALKADGQYRLSNFANNLTDYTNKIAGKQSAADRGVEYLFGRDAMNLTNALKGRYGAAAVGANIASAITNTIPLVQATANTSYTKLARGIWDAVVSNDGFADRSAFLVNRRGSDMLSLTGKEKFASGTMALMSMADNIVSEAIVRAKYYELTQNGMTEADAMEAADDYARGLMAGRSTGEMPTVFNSKNPVLGLFTQFQLEVNNQFQWMFMDLPRERREEAGKSLVAAFLRLFIGSWLYNELIETITGRRSAFDPINMVNETVGDVSGYELPNTFHALSDLVSGRDVDFTTDQANNVWDFVTKSFERTASELPFAGSWLGGGRIPVGNILETVPNLVEAGAGLVGDSASEYKLQKLGDAALEIGQYLLPGAGGQIRKSIQGIDAAIRGGRYRYTTEGEEYLQYPTSGGFDSYVQGALFGRSSFRGAQEWADDNYASLSVDATATYDQLVELGHDYLDVYDLVSKISRAKKTDTQSAASVKLDMIDTAEGYTDEEKAILYYGLVASEDEREKIKEMMDAGVSGESVYYASAVFRDINSTSYGEDKTDDEKYSELRSYVKSNKIDMSVLDLEDGERYSTSDVKRVYLDDTKISDEEKAYIYRYLLAGEKEAEVFDECLERGDDAGEIYDYLYRIYTSKNQAEKLEALGSSKISDESKYDIYYFDYALDDEIEALDELKNSAPLGEIVETVTELRRLKKSEEKRDSLSSSPLSIYEQSVYYFSAMASKSQLEKLDGLLDGGISQVEYYDFLMNTLDISGENKKAQILSYIDGTGLSSKEKDLLYLAAGYSENTIDDAPWHSGSFGGGSVFGGGGIFGTSSIFGDSGIFGSNNSIFGDSGIFGEKGIFG